MAIAFQSIQDPYGLSQAGSVLGQALGQKMQRQHAAAQQQQEVAQRKQHGSILGEVFQGIGPESSPEQINSALGSALSQGVPPEMLQQYVGLSQSLQKPSSASLGNLGRDDLVGLLGRLGLDDEQAANEADIYRALPQGGKTAYANYLFDRMQRKEIGGKRPQAVEEVADVSVEEVETFDFPEVNTFSGLTSKEKVGREKDLFNFNAKAYSEISTKKKGADGELLSLEQLERLNDTGRLPEGIGRLNVNWKDGELILPAAANKETQLFVKSVNDFTTKAKDSFGSRISNFELERFLKRLPSLGNTEEGRRLILAQMKGTQQLNQLYYDSIQEVYDKYGIRNIDNQQVEKIAKDLRADKEEVLKGDVNRAVKAQDIYEARQSLSSDQVLLESPSGELKFGLKSQAEQAKKKGFKVL